MQFTRLILLCFLSVLFHPTGSAAQWATDGNPLGADVGDQVQPVATTDGAGGAIVAWADFRSGGNYDIYAQRVNAFGVVQWTVNGIAVRAAGNNQSSPAIASDDAGGAIIFWTHVANNGSADIYAQHVTSAGTLHWPSNGILICSAQFDQLSPRAIPDGSGGAIVTWQDNRAGSDSAADVFAQRVNVSGVVQWAADGVGVCTAANAQWYARLTGDGTGGAIMAWSDFRDGSTYGVYARRVNSAGAAQWIADGVAIGTNTGYQDPPAITTDGSGGAIVAWDANTGDGDVLVQRINTSGIVQWAPGGVSVCAADFNQLQPDIVSDGLGGAIVAWQDLRVNGTNEDIYAQRVNASGVAQWTPDGVPLCTASGASFQPLAVSDKAGGAVVSWIDTRTGDYNIYARRINGAGTPLWTANGVSLCSATNSQLMPTTTSDGSGGAITAWADYRTGSADVYANRVTPGGVVPTPVAETPVPSFAAKVYPNPFSTATAVDITVDHESDLNMDIFDVAGRRVRAINVGRVAAGAKSLRFDGRDERGVLLPSGLYFCRITAGSATVTRKMVIQR